MDRGHAGAMLQYASERAQASSIELPPFKDIIAQAYNLAIGRLRSDRADKGLRVGEIDLLDFCPNLGAYTEDFRQALTQRLVETVGLTVQPVLRGSFFLGQRHMLVISW
jgi:hypothetical protein